MANDLDILRNNFLEWEQAAKTSSQLIANPCGTKLYTSSRCWGCVWRVYYWIACLFAGEKYRTEPVRLAIIKMQGIFTAHLSLIRENVQTYEKYLKACCEGRKIQDMDKFLKSMEDITAFNDATRPFLQLVRNKHPAIISVIKTYVINDSQIEGDREQVACNYFDPSSVDSFGPIQDMIDFQGHIQDHLPLSELKKLYWNEDFALTEVDNRKIKEFIKQISSISSSTVHLALKAVCALLSKEMAHLEPPRVAKLELQLRKKGCELFEQFNADDEHYKWRQTLAPGRKVWCNGRELVLAQKLENSQKHDIDREVFFRIEGRPNELLWISHNRAVIGMHHERNRSFDGIPKCVQIAEVDAEGVCAIVEELHSRLDQYDWSHDAQAATELVNVCVQMLIHYKNSEMTPLYLSPEFLMLDPTNTLKFRRVTTLIAGNYSSLIDFVFKLAIRSFPEGESVEASNSIRYFMQILQKATLDEDNDPRMKFLMHMVDCGMQQKETSAKAEAVLGSESQICSHDVVQQRAQRIYELTFRRMNRTGTREQHLWNSFLELYRGSELYNPLRLQEDFIKKRRSNDA